MSIMARKKTKEAPLFGQRLAEYRQARGFTQEELAKILGISRKMIDHYECRTQNPTAAFLMKVSKILQVSVDELLGIKDSSIKRGPMSKIERQLEELRNLPSTKQKLASDMLQTVIQASEPS